LQRRGLDAQGSERFFPARPTVMMWALRCAARASDEVLRASLEWAPPLQRGRPSSTMAPRVPCTPVSIVLMRREWAPLAALEKRYRCLHPKINRSGVLRAVFWTLHELSEGAFVALVQERAPDDPQASSARCLRCSTEILVKQCANAKCRKPLVGGRPQAVCAECSPEARGLSKDEMADRRRDDLRCNCCNTWLGESTVDTIAAFDELMGGRSQAGSAMQ